MDLATAQHKAVVALFHKTTCFHQDPTTSLWGEFLNEKGKKHYRSMDTDLAFSRLLTQWKAQTIIYIIWLIRGGKFRKVLPDEEKMTEKESSKCD